MPVLPGWLKVRLNGCAALGAVEVLGGAENVRAPREPELIPPPIRASAAAIIITGKASVSTTAKGFRSPRKRCMNLMVVSSVPGKGKNS